MRKTCILWFFFLTNTLCDYTPIIIWHAMGDYCSNPTTVIKAQLESVLPGVHVICLEIGHNMTEEIKNGFFMHPDEQIEMACKIIQSNPLLSNGYNAIGFSQGSQFLRALAQRCPEPKMKNLVSLGGQHQGVYGLPLCEAVNVKLCNYVRRFLNQFAYLSYFQANLVQATYWQNPLNHKAYVQGNTFLADINNEKVINQTYVDNLQSMENIIFVKFEDDEFVQPKESQWFGFYKLGQAKETQPLQNCTVYNRLGLDKMNRDGKLHFLSVPGKHLKFEWSWFVENIIDRFLRDK